MKKHNTLHPLCQQAIDEIESQIKKQPLQSSIYNQWMDKWSDLYKQFDLPALFGSAEKFCDYFYAFQELSVFLSFTEDAALASDRFSQLIPSDENGLLLWLVDNEGLGSALSLFVYDTLHDGLDENKQVIDCGVCKIDATEFQKLTIFCNHFHDVYYLKLRQYSTLTEEEKSIAANDAELEEKILSLTYHLKKRGVIK